MNDASPYIQCGLCGHRHPADRARARGYIECACGLRLEAAPGGRRPHRLAGAIISIVLVAALGGAAYLWARGLG